MRATECDQCGEVTNNQTAGNACHTCNDGIMLEIEACPDCGARNEVRGHMTCQYPSNTQEAQQCGEELNWLSKVFYPPGTCPGHGSDLVDGRCPDCEVEAEDWPTDTQEAQL